MLISHRYFSEMGKYGQEWGCPPIFICVYFIVQIITSVAHLMIWPAQVHTGTVEGGEDAGTEDDEEEEDIDMLEKELLQMEEEEGAGEEAGDELSEEEEEGKGAAANDTVSNG